MQGKVKWIQYGFLMAVLFMVSQEVMAAAGKDHPIRLDVDASEVYRRILHARLWIPVRPGSLTLYYPQWIPGEHGPTGPITDLTGLRISAEDKEISWSRDDVDMYAFYCRIPLGVKEIQVSFDFLLNPSTEGFTNAASATDNLAAISWNQLLLYPEGKSAREVYFLPTLQLPAGWKCGTSLSISSQSESLLSFEPVSLEQLVDSPVLCGKYFAEIPIGPQEPVPHFLEIACDSSEGLNLSSDMKDKFGRLIVEADAMFGCHHYHSYRFLLTLSDHVAKFGLEHHQSSDNRIPERVLIDDEIKPMAGFLLAHEYVHSWNGKYRRPADMATPDFQKPMRTRLLWVYEGLTEYLGLVLSVRSGLLNFDHARDDWANIAAWAMDQRGRSWRPLEDTTVAAQILYEARLDGQSWRRGVDFYDEGALIWLEADTMIRQQTDGKQSLDDFCRSFFGGGSEEPEVIPYTLNDLINGLNKVASYDWKTFFQERVSQISDEAPLQGLQQSGWQLTFSDTPFPVMGGFRAWQQSGSKSPGMNLSASLGLTLDAEGNVEDIIPGKAAERAGIAPGMKLVAVNSRRWTPVVLGDAIQAAKSTSEPLAFLMENNDFFRTYMLNYHAGEKYPRLERNSANQDWLSRILSPLKP